MTSGSPSTDLEQPAKECLSVPAARHCTHLGDSCKPPRRAQIPAQTHPSQYHGVFWFEPYCFVHQAADLSGPIIAWKRLHEFSDSRNTLQHLADMPRLTKLSVPLIPWETLFRWAWRGMTRRHTG